CGCSCSATSRSHCATATRSTACSTVPSPRRGRRRRRRSGTRSCGARPRLRLGRMATTAVDAAVAAAHADLDAAQHDLEALVRIPSISGDPEHFADVDTCAASIGDLMREAGLQHVREMRIDGGLPNVVGEWTKRPRAPTGLVYAHA